MGGKRGLIMRRRVKILFEDGEKTYGVVDLTGEKPMIVTGGMPYDLESFAATGATVAVNDTETLKLLQSAGVKARPTGRQTTITISVSERFRERMDEACGKFHIRTTTILTEAGEKWLEERGL